MPAGALYVPVPAIDGRLAGAERIEDTLTLAQRIKQIKAPILNLFSIPTRQRINQPRFTLFNEERHFIAR